MLFWLGFIALVAGIVFSANGVEWFEGEDNIAGPLIAIGAVLLALQVIIFAFVAKKVAKVQRRAFDRFDRF